MCSLATTLEKNLPYTTQHYSSEDYLILQGQLCTKLCLGVEGWLKLTICTDDGTDSIVGFCGPGAYHGLSYLFRDEVATYNVSGLNKATVHSFNKADVEKFLRENPQYMVEVIQILGKVLSNSKVIGAAASNREAVVKVHSLLMHIAQVYGKEEDAGWRLPFTLTQQDITQMLGLSRVSISESLKTLKVRKMIAEENKVLLVFKSTIIDC